MKNYIVLYSLILLFACQKENKPSKEYNTYSVKIISKNTKNPLVNYDLIFSQQTWIDYRTIVDSIMGYATTDNQGNASFTYETKSIINKPSVFYTIRHYFNDTLPFDSVADNYRYNGHWEFQNDDKKILEAYSMCHVRLIIEQIKYIEMNIDSIYLETPFDNYMNVNIGLDYHFSNLECSENVKLKYYYFIKGVKSKEYTKNIFIKRSSKYMYETVYELEL
jgi:hypothetical protein